MKTISEQQQLTHKEWIAWIRKNKKARENYYMKRYGNLDKMEMNDAVKQEKIDLDCMKEEME